MKTLITLNIGLNSINNTRVDVHHALGAIAACGVSITTSAVVAGEWEGKFEPCLFVQGFVTDPHGIAFRAQLYLAARLLSQHVLALYFDGKGELVGPNPEGWTFDADLFHFHPVPRVPVDADDERRWNGLDVSALPHQLSECQAIQRETAERLAKRERVVDGYTKAQFIEFLTETLIPDLERDGYESTAQDFRTAVEFLRA